MLPLSSTNVHRPDAADDDCFWTGADFQSFRARLHDEARAAGYDTDEDRRALWQFVRSTCMDPETVINTQKNQFAFHTSLQNAADRRHPHLSNEHDKSLEAANAFRQPVSDISQNGSMLKHRARAHDDASASGGSFSAAPSSPKTSFCGIPKLSTSSAASSSMTSSKDSMDTILPRMRSLSTSSSASSSSSGSMRSSKRVRFDQRTLCWAIEQELDQCMQSLLQVTTPQRLNQITQRVAELQAELATLSLSSHC